MGDGQGVKPRGGLRALVKLLPLRTRELRTLAYIKKGKNVVGQS